jgi:hypothetical protein
MATVRNFRLDKRKGTAQGLVGLWGPGPTGGGTLFDMSGRGNHGTLTNIDPATDWVFDAERGWVLDFDGVNDFVAVPALDGWVSGRTNFSLATWIKFTSALNNKMICGWWFGKNCMLRILTDGGIQWSITTAGGTVSVSSVAIGWNDGTWHHVVGTYDGSVMRLYIDGSQDNSDNQTGAATGTDDFTIGALKTGANAILASLSGQRVSSRNLSAAEIQHIYESTRRDPYSDIAMRPRRVYKAAVAAGTILPQMMQLAN